jgi:HEAT repeat protein
LATTAGLYVQKPGETGTSGEVKIWELKNLPTTPPSVVPTAAQLETLWQTLAATDGTRAYRAVWTLSDAPKQAVPFLSERVRPPKARDLAQEIAQLVRELDDDNFAVRERAGASLELLGRAARPALLKARHSPSLEVRRRVAQLLEKKDEGLPPLSADERRDLRVVEVLLRIGTAEAREVLRKLASGEAKAQATQEAIAALAWLERGTSRESVSP